MKVTVLQPGARHNYSQSRFLHQCGSLQRLYTDFALGDGPLSRLVRNLIPSAQRRAKFSRRIAAGLPQSRIRLFPASARQNRVGRPANWPILHRDLAETDVFFTQYYAGGHGLRPRIRPDAKIVADVFTVPSTHKIVNAECARFPEWDERPFDEALSARYEQFTRDMLDDCDALFCPAQSVIGDIASYGPQYAAKCILVPYGSSLSFPHAVEPEPRRILFAGSLTLRKGPQYVKMAADLLARTEPGFTFVFAGSVSDVARRQLEGPNVEILGHLSKERMVEEFSRADVFILPSLAEGSAGVVLEAMSAGLPVVVSRGAGVDFDDGGPGAYVPDRDPDAIAEALVRICGDRTLREHMSRAAQTRAGAYDNAVWAQHFVGALRAVASSGEGAPCAG